MAVDRRQFLKLTGLAGEGRREPRLRDTGQAKLGELARLVRSVSPASG